MKNFQDEKVKRQGLELANLFFNGSMGDRKSSPQSRVFRDQEKGNLRKMREPKKINFYRRKKWKQRLKEQNSKNCNKT
jgi:hypothetical protein